MECLSKVKEVFKKIQQFEQQLNSNINITINEAMVLCNLDKTVKSSGVIASDTGISVSRTSRVLLSLEQKGYVTRNFCKIDKRKMMFDLTLEGIMKKKEIKNIELDLDFNI